MYGREERGRVAKGIKEEIKEEEGRQGKTSKRKRDGRKKEEEAKGKSEGAEEGIDRIE